MNQKTTEISEYDQKAIDFLKKTETEFSVAFLKYDKYFEDDKEARDIYEITLKRGSRAYKFKFGQSINCSGKFICYPPEGKTRSQKYLAGGDNTRNKDYRIPTAYDVLASVTKYDVGSFEDFCSEFGYDTDSRKAEKIYNAVLNEYNNLKMLYSDDEMQEMGEIQ